MSIEFSQTFGNVTVEVWAGDIGDMAMAKLAPVIDAAFKDEKMQKSHVKKHMVVAYENGLVVGGMLMDVINKTWDSCDIMTYQEAVLPAEQRRGIGSKMFDALKLWAPQAQVSVIYSCVDVGDDVGEAFILKQDGFSLYDEDDYDLTFSYVVRL